MEGTISLIKRAQDGDELACTKLFGLIRDHHMMRYTGRYRNRNVLISEAEVESEFMIGCWRALSKAKLDVGNPLSFMCWKGFRVDRRPTTLKRLQKSGGSQPQQSPLRSEGSGATSSIILKRRAFATWMFGLLDSIFGPEEWN